MSKRVRTSLKWHQIVGLVLIVPLLVLSAWTLIDPDRAKGWIFAAAGSFLAVTAYDWYGRLALGRARLWLVGLTLVLAAFQLYLGLSILTGGRSLIGPISANLGLDRPTPQSLTP